MDENRMKSGEGMSRFIVAVAIKFGTTTGAISVLCRAGYQYRFHHQGVGLDLVGFSMFSLAFSYLWGAILGVFMWRRRGCGPV
jgi:hypothetical protein